MPVTRAYCPWPARMAAIAASFANSGPSKSGKPWARLMAPRSSERRVISAKIVVPNPERRALIEGRIAPLVDGAGVEGGDVPRQFHQRRVVDVHHVPRFEVIERKILAQRRVEAEMIHPVFRGEERSRYVVVA